MTKAFPLADLSAGLKLETRIRKALMRAGSSDGGAILVASSPETGGIVSSDAIMRALVSAVVRGEELAAPTRADRRIRVKKPLVPPSRRKMRLGGRLTVSVLPEISEPAHAQHLMELVRDGVLCVAPINVKSANAIAFRLIGLGVAPMDLAEPGILRLLMAPRAVPMLCAGCARPVEPPAHVPFGRGIPRSLSRRQLWMRDPRGCHFCNGSEPRRASIGPGCSGTLVLGEIIEPTQRYLSHVEFGDVVAARAHWLRPLSRGGMDGLTLSSAIWNAAVAGLVDFREAEGIENAG
ncbi:hypothetical protein [Pontivivens ytuae]|uniref:Type II secretion system protein E n=1 Tax=Pontivivens ytuae TaxID=2789856 RepID=A0A7S9LRX8_9RHOB|nr:hypothetical protein [Pontivivens ytuae]QPH54148.1 hypothetical protein I0K15_20650 [Pontivivens ytuae]